HTRPTLSDTRTSVPGRLVVRPPRRHLPNPIVTDVQDEEISDTVARHTTSWWGKETKLSGSRGSAVPAKTSSSISRHSGDRPPRSHLSNSLVVISDEKRSDTVAPHISSGIQLG